MKWCSDCGRRILGNASDEMPDSEASGELITIAHSAELVALDGEMLSDRSEAGQECLRSSWLAKAFHAPFAFACWLMTILGPVVDPGCSFDEHMLDVSQFGNLDFRRRIAA